jgi:hypothetical protein
VGRCIGRNNPLSAFANQSQEAGLRPGPGPGRLVRRSIHPLPSGQTDRLQRRSNKPRRY